MADLDLFTSALGDLESCLAAAREPGGVLADLPPSVAFTVTAATVPVPLGRDYVCVTVTVLSAPDTWTYTQGQHRFVSYAGGGAGESILAVADGVLYAHGLSDCDRAVVVPGLVLAATYLETTWPCN